MTLMDSPSGMIHADNALVERVHKNDVKYRFTLVDYDKQFA